jgi:acyl-CoA synthetase (AMP-forming)/AMP-acid ligase II
VNIGDLPRMNAGRAPGKVALTDANGTTTYADLDARSNALANALLALGVEPRTNVAVLLTNRAEHVETLFALAKLGAPGVPMDPKWLGRRRRV